MKKTLLLIFASITFTLSAQKKETSETLSLKHHEFLLAVKKMNAFNSIKVPEKYDKVTDNGVLLYFHYIDERRDYYIMPDDEFRIFESNLSDGALKRDIYLRFPNKVVYGYDLKYYKDGVIKTENIRAPYVGLYDYDFKPVK